MTRPIALTIAGCPLRASFQDQVQASVGSLPGVSEVSLDFDVMSPEEKTALTSDIREVYAEAKGNGFDTKIMRQVVRMRRLDKADRQEQEAVLDLYLSALGMRN